MVQTKYWFFGKISLEGGFADEESEAGPEAPDGVTLDFSRPGKSMDNATIESFNGSFRDECLNVNWFLSMEDAREKIEKWRRDYNEFRPHSALADLTPHEFIDIFRKSMRSQKTSFLAGPVFW